MKKSILQQTIITQELISQSHNARQLISDTAHFLFLILQPKEILFCQVVDELECMARQRVEQQLTFYESSLTQFDCGLSTNKVWELANKPATYSDYITITELEDPQEDEWNCIILNDIYIFIHEPNKLAMQQWQEEPLLASLIRLFCSKLENYQQQKTNKRYGAARDKNDAILIQQLKVQKEFSADLLKLQQITLALTSCTSLDELYKQSVETLRNELGFDRACLFLINESSHRINATFGTDEQGNTTDESHHSYDMENMISDMLQATFDSDKFLVVIEDTPLYTESQVVGFGWNSMVILREGDSIIGWMALDNLINQRPLLKHKQQLLEAYGAMLSQAIIRKREEYNLKILHNSIIEMSPLSSPMEICKVAVRIAQDKLKLDRIAVFLTNDDAQNIQGTYGTDINGKLVDESSFQGPVPNSQLVKRALETPDHLAVEEHTPLFHNRKIVGHGWNAILQLRSNNKVIGLLISDNLINNKPLSMHLRQLIRLFGANLSEMIARKQSEEAEHQLNQALESKVAERTKALAETNGVLEKANRKLSKLSLVDGLTGVGNRRCFDLEIKTAWNKACRISARLSIVMFDVDNFKAYNDFYGHLEGDECLKKIATLLNQYYRRAGEVVARYGGEEFIVIVCDTEQEQVVAATHKVIQAIYDSKLIHEKAELGYTTVSAGIASTIVCRDDSFTNLIEKADNALYQAKRKGKNQACIAED